MEVSVKTVTKVYKNDGTFHIAGIPDLTVNGTKVPFIYDAELVSRQNGVIVDNVEGKEGELLITYEEGVSDATLNENGELIIDVQEPDTTSRYSRGGQDDVYLRYDDYSLSDDYVITPGNSITIRLIARLSGTLQFTDLFDNMTPNITREYCISDDGGMLFTEWEDKNTFMARTIMTDGIAVLMIRCTNTLDYDVTFQTFTATGTITNMVFDAPTYRASMFNGLIGRPDFTRYEDNIFKKLYFRGIIPVYVTRCENRDPDEDRDYIDLFKSVARFFTLFIQFFKRWEGMRYDYDLLLEQVRQYGIYFNEETVTLEELQYLVQNLMSQAQQRGTKMIFTRKGETLPNGTTAQIDGEFIRLLKNNVWDDLMYDEMKLWETGWVMHRCSPMYKGTLQSSNLNKTPAAPNGDFVGQTYNVLSKYIVTLEGATGELSTDGDKRVFRMYGTSVKCAGFGRKDESVTPSALSEKNLYLVDCELDYEVCFAFKINNEDDDYNGIEFLFATEGFDKNKKFVQDAFTSIDGSTVTQQFWKQDLKIWKNKLWIFARGIIHAYGSKSVYGTHTNLGIGTDLTFNNSRVKYILPKIQIVSQSGVNINYSVWNYAIRPLVRGNNIIPLKTARTYDAKSFGFIQANNFTFTYARNNNNALSDDELAVIIERYLYPMDTTNMIHIYNR